MPHFILFSALPNSGKLWKLSQSMIYAKKKPTNGLVHGFILYLFKLGCTLFSRIVISEQIAYLIPLLMIIRMFGKIKPNELIKNYQTRISVFSLRNMDILK